jgi:hypothetical protein
MNVGQGLEFVDFIGIGRVASAVPGLSARAAWLLRQRVGKESENGSVPYVVDRCGVGRDASGDHLIRDHLCSFLFARLDERGVG